MSPGGKHVQLMRGCAALPKPASARALFDWGCAALAGVSETPERDADRLMTATTGVSRAALYAFPDRLVETDAAMAYEQAIGRRARGEPVAYIAGSQGFHALDLTVNAHVLVPRPETELIVDAVCEMTDERAAPNVLDAGTGSGALALAIKLARPAATVTGLDLSRDALQIARDNGIRLGLDVHWIESDWFGAVANERFDFIVCNPPYVASNDPHMDLLIHEPRLALDGGEDGLEAIRAVLGSAGARLAPGGVLLLEHGYDQAGSVARIAAEMGLALVQSIEDFAGHPRVAVLRTAP